MKNHESKDDYLKVIDQFNSLGLDQKLQIFGNLPSKTREDLIAVVSRPGEIVRKISEEEMFFTIKDLGEENAQNLIALTTGRQLMYLLDIDLWTRNDLNVASIAKWFRILAGIGEDKILQLVQITDPELLCSILNRAIFVKLKYPDIDLTEQLDFLPPFTLDNSYFIDFKIPSIEDCVKEFLDCIFRHDSNYYMKLVQALTTGWLAEYEDTAYKWRSARLADHGFPNFEEAIDIYSLFNPALINTTEKSSECFDNPEDLVDSRLLKYPAVILKGRNAFEKTLSGIQDDGLRDRINSEIAHVANKVMVADGKDAGSITELKNSLEKTSGYINLAIEDVARRQQVGLLDIICSNHMEHLFRHGYTLIMQTQYKAKRFILEREGGVENLGLPLAPLLTGLLQKRPIFDPAGIDSGTKRDFQFLSDLQMIDKMMETADREDNWETL